MPRLYVDHKRHRALFGSFEHATWERINADLYLVGGLLFVVGSILFFPAFKPWRDWGVGCFLTGSLLYLAVTGHDLGRIVASRNSNRAELPEAIAYLVGTVLFTVGSVLFFSDIDKVITAAALWLTGSVIFVAAACINLLQIVHARSERTLLLMNLTAVSFIVGGVLFAVGAIPFFWLAQAPGHRVLHSYLAGEFLFGSLMFAAGGACIRARTVGSRRGDRA